MIKDRNIEWNVKRVFIPPQAMSGFAADQVTGLGAGAPIYQEIDAGSQISGLQIGAAGDEIFTHWKLPWDLDRTAPIAARILFAHASTDADDPDWKVFMKGWKAGAALSAANSSADETLTFPALAVAGVALALCVTAWQKTGASPFDADDLFALLCIEANGLGSASANEITLLGLELAYTINSCGESNKRDDTVLTLDNLARY
jgi:hypothetical protein